MHHHISRNAMYLHISRNADCRAMPTKQKRGEGEGEGGGVLVNTELDTDLSPNSIMFHPRFDDDDDDAALE